MKTQSVILINTQEESLCIWVVTEWVGKCVCVWCVRVHVRVRVRVRVCVCVCVCVGIERKG